MFRLLSPFVVLKYRIPVFTFFGEISKKVFDDSRELKTFSDLISLDDLWSV